MGSQATNLAIGDRITAEPSLECRQCRSCRSGRYNLCEDLKFVGTAATIPDIDGAFGEHAAVPESHCYLLGDRHDCGAGALAEPLAVGAHAVMRAGALAGSRVLIVGGGTIGQMVLAVARVVGATDVTMADIDPFARKFSLEHGACAAFDPREANTSGGQQAESFDVVFEASGSPSALCFAYTAAARGARVVQIGTQPSELSLPANLVMSKELTVLGSFRYAHVFPWVLDLMAAGRIDPGDLISVVYPYANMQKAMERAVAKGGIVKVQVNRGE